jgi:hypothetical protein
MEKTITLGQMIQVWQDGGLRRPWGEDKVSYASHCMIQHDQNLQLHHVSQAGRVTMQFVDQIFCLTMVQVPIICLIPLLGCMGYL